MEDGVPPRGRSAGTRDWTGMGLLGWMRWVWTRTWDERSHPRWGFPSFCPTHPVRGPQIPCTKLPRRRASNHPLAVSLARRRRGEWDHLAGTALLLVSTLIPALWSFLHSFLLFPPFFPSFFFFTYSLDIHSCLHSFANECERDRTWQRKTGGGRTRKEPSETCLSDWRDK